MLFLSAMLTSGCTARTVRRYELACGLLSSLAKHPTEILSPVGAVVPVRNVAASARPPDGSPPYARMGPTLLLSKKEYLDKTKLHDLGKDLDIGLHVHLAGRNKHVLLLAALVKSR